MTEPGASSPAAAAPVLWQIRFSHFNEKARWTLDYKGIAHRRRSVLPGLHVIRARRLYGGDTFPVLVLDGRAINDSAKIIDTVERLHPDPPLYPDNKTDRGLALDLQRYFDTELGPHIRRYLFHWVLPHSRQAKRLLTEGFGGPSAVAYRASYPAVRATMRRVMSIDAEGAEVGRRKTLAALDRIEAELSPAGYLVGDRFTVADLAGAALLFPLVRPAGIQYPLLDPWPEPVEEFRSSIAARPAFKWVEEMWRRHRGTSAELAA